MKKLKRIIVIALASLFAATVFVSCGKPDNDLGLTDLKVPSYDNDQQFWIGAWNDPFLTVEDWQFARDMGITHMFVDPDTNFDTVQEIAEETGMKVVVQNGANSNAQLAAKNFAQYPAVCAMNWDDEASKDEISTKVKEAAELHMQYYPELLYLITQYPNWATEYFGGLTWEQFLDYFYEQALSKITTGTKMISYDFYPLLEKDNVRSLRSEWLPGLNVLAKAAKKYDADTHVFIQAAEETFDGGGKYPVLTEAELRYQFNVYLAFGIRNFTFFQYRAGFSNQFGAALVRNDKSCMPYPLYYGAQQVVSELQSLAPVYLDFDWIGTMGVAAGEKSDALNLDFDGIEEIPFLLDYVVEQDTLFGQFKDKDGNDGLMITNFVQPYEELSNTVQLQFKDARKLMVFTNGIKEVWVLDGTKTFTLDLEPGQGAFVIPVA